MKNLTPHDITVNGVTYPKSGIIARVSVAQEKIGELDNGTPIMVTTYGEVENLPSVGGEPFLVSAMVLGRLGVEYRNQAFAPDTGITAKRDEKGQIIEVVQLVTV